MKLGALLLVAICFYGFGEASACAKPDSTPVQCSSKQLASILSAIYSKKVQRIKIDDKNLFIVKDSIKSKRIFVKVLSSKIFDREAECLSEIQRLELPFFPKYYGYHQLPNDSVALMLEYVSSCDLHTLITKKWRKCSHSSLVLYAAQLAFAIHTLHQNRIVHRDIKLENIVVSSDRTHIKLVDYDCAVIAESAEQMNSISGLCGSIHSLAPEVLNNATYSYKCDWYSFGVVLFRMHSGGKMLPSNEVQEAKDHSTNRPIKDCNTKALIHKLLKPESERLSSLDEIKQEPYFAGIDWFYIENYTANRCPLK